MKNRIFTLGVASVAACVNHKIMLYSYWLNSRLKTILVKPSNPAFPVIPTSSHPAKPNSFIFAKVSSVRFFSPFASTRNIIYSNFFIALTSQRNYFSSWINSPLSSFGSNHVDFGGISLPASEMLISSSIDVGNIENATIILLLSTRAILRFQLKLICNESRPLFDRSQIRTWHMLAVAYQRLGCRSCSNIECGPALA